MIMVRQAFWRQSIPQQFSEPTFHSVADHRIADSLGYGNSEAFTEAAIGPGQQNETGPRNAQPVIGSKKIFTLPDNRQN